jgi:hypothetical protein
MDALLFSTTLACYLLYTYQNSYGCNY